MTVRAVSAGTTIAGMLVLAGMQCAAAQTTLTIESWRSDDAAVWNDVILPAFMKAHPDIKVVFSPTVAAQFNSALNAKLEGGTAGDLITCRPFDISLNLYNRGYLANLNDLPGMKYFSDQARGAWSTDDGSVSYCVPMASTILGFIYNADVFEELGLKAPTTMDEFHAVLEAIKANGEYAPLAFGLGDAWVTPLLAFHNMAANYFGGEDGRQAILDGKLKLTDPSFVSLLTEVAGWKNYLADGAEVQKNADSRQLFLLERAAIYPAGSWDIAPLTKEADFALGAFRAPVQAAGDKCYINDHTDIGIGLNSKSPNAEQARVFLDWIASPEFASLYANALPGFFPLSNTPVATDNALTSTFASWRQECGSTIRFSYQYLSRGEPTLENDISRVTNLMMRGEMTPEAAAAEMQGGLDKWYKPRNP